MTKSFVAVVVSGVVALMVGFKVRPFSESLSTPLGDWEAGALTLPWLMSLDLGEIESARVMNGEKPNPRRRKVPILVFIVDYLYLVPEETINHFNLYLVH